MKVMFVPPGNESNRYLSSLSEALDRCGVTVADYPWRSTFSLLKPLMGSERPDVIHIHWLHALSTGSTIPRTVFKGLWTPVLLLIARLLGIRIVWTVHNLTQHDPDHPLWDLSFRIMFAHLICNRLIVHCAAAERLVRETYHLSSDTSVAIIPHGHYADAYPRNASEYRGDERLGIDPDDVVFTFFGRIRPYKQVSYLIEQFDGLGLDRAKLVIAGNPQSDALERQIRDTCRGRADVLTRLEFVPDREVAVYMEAADVVVLPYRDILTSGTAILAMSFSRPVIVPEIGCLGDLITDGTDGFLYDPAQENGLRRAMECALASDLRRMGRAANQRVRERDWETVARRTKGVYCG